MKYYYIYYNHYNIADINTNTITNRIRLQTEFVKFKLFIIHPLIYYCIIYINIYVVIYTSRNVIITSTMYIAPFIILVYVPAIITCMVHYNIRSTYTTLLQINVLLLITVASVKIASKLAPINVIHSFNGIPH